MFAPRGYTAVPQEAFDGEEDEDNLTTSYEQRETNPKNNKGMAGKLSTENEEGAKEPRGKRNRVRFESKCVEEKQEPMSKARRICFVISLMICTLTIFVFAFTVPCKHAACKVNNMPRTITEGKVQFHGNWTMSFPGYSSLAGISFHETSRDGEVIINYNNSGTSGNIHKRGQEESKKGGILSLSEEYGDTVWLYNASYAIKLIECKSAKDDMETCLIESSQGELQLVEPKKNKIIWSTRILIGSISPSIIINIADCDGDGLWDILLSYNHATHMVRTSNHSTRSYHNQIRVISGKTGHTIGGILNIPQTHLIKQISLHSTSHSTNIIFVLTVGFQGHLKVIPIQKFYEKILEAKSGVPIDLFQNTTVELSQFVSLKHAPLVKDLNQDSQEDIVLVTLDGNKHSLTAIDGSKLDKMWRISFGSRKILSQPVIGHFNDDDILDILVVLEDPVLAMLNQSLIQILSGRDGDVLWSRYMKIAQSTSPRSASIGKKSDAFFMWIEKEKVHKYTKTVPSKKPMKNHLPRKSSFPSTHERLLKDRVMDDTENTKTRYYHPRHRRSEESSDIIQSREKIKSSIREMEELDSLVKEVNKKHSEPREQTELLVNDDHKLNKQEKIQDGMLKSSDNQNERRKENKNFFLDQGHLALFNKLLKSDQILSKNPGSPTDSQTIAVGISTKSNISTSLSITDEFSSGGIRMLSKRKINEISNKENKSLQSNTSLTQEKRSHHFKVLVKNGTKGWELNNRSSHETQYKILEERNYSSNGRNWRNQSVLDQVKDINTSSSLHSQQTNLILELKNDSISNATIKQGSHPSWRDGESRIGLVKENVQKLNGSLPNSIKRVRNGGNHQNETSSNQLDFKNQSENTVLHVNVTNNSSFKSVGLLYQLSTMKKRHNTTNATLKGYSNEFQHFSKIKQQNRSGLRKIPDRDVHYDKNQAGDCKEGTGFALIAIIPKSRKNSFTIVAQEDSFRDKAVISQTSCDMYWPWINSNPIVRDVGRDGFLEIFYVVNYKNQEELETMMKVKKFILKLNRRR